MPYPGNFQKVITKDPTARQMRRCTTLWNIC